MQDSEWLNSVKEKVWQLTKDFRFRRYASDMGATVADTKKVESGETLTHAVLSSSAYRMSEARFEILLRRAHKGEEFENECIVHPDEAYTLVCSSTVSLSGTRCSDIVQAAWHYFGQNGPNECFVDCMKEKGKELVGKRLEKWLHMRIEDLRPNSLMSRQRSMLERLQGYRNDALQNFGKFESLCNGRSFRPFAYKPAYVVVGRVCALGTSCLEGSNISYC